MNPSGMCPYCGEKINQCSCERTGAHKEAEGMNKPPVKETIHLCGKIGPRECPCWKCCSSWCPACMDNSR